ncbi:hypothetical protein LCGC14_2005610, partial [marine sediment metagenome]
AVPLCIICAAAQFVCDRLIKPQRDQGEFTKDNE